MDRYHSIGFLMNNYTAKYCVTIDIKICIYTSFKTRSKYRPRQAKIISERLLNADAFTKVMFDFARLRRQLETMSKYKKEKSPKRKKLYLNTISQTQIP